MTNEEWSDQYEEGYNDFDRGAKPEYSEDVNRKDGVWDSDEAEAYCQGWVDAMESYSGEEE